MKMKINTKMYGQRLISYSMSIFLTNIGNAGFTFQTLYTFYIFAWLFKVFSHKWTNFP
jgi:hypothetical protein